MEYGGNMSLTCIRIKVSRLSVEKFQKTNPEFAQACAEAVAHSNHLVEAAVYRGATVGDLKAVYQGGLLVGYQRVRNVKDAELALKLRGELDREEAAGRGAPRVQLVAREDLPGIVRDVAAKLFAARQAQRRPLLDAATGRLENQGANLHLDRSNRVNGPEKSPAPATETPDPAPEPPPVDPYAP